MKKILVTLAVTLSPACAFAQVLSLQPGFEQQTLLSVSAPVGGFDFDSSGNIFYIGGSTDTQVVEATQASSYGTLTPIVDYNTFTYGSFVTVHGGTVYYGDSVDGGNVNASSTTAVSPTPGPTPIANMPGNYDLAFSGATALVSANISGSNNEVFRLNTTTDKYAELLNTNGDYSGPIAVTATGELIYGESGLNGSGAADGGIYIFSAASVANAISSGIPLQLANAETIIPDSGNSSFTLGPDNQLFQAFSPYNGGAATLTIYNLTNGNSTLIGAADNDGYYFSGMSFFDGDLTVAETDGYSFTDFIQITEIPEPGAASLGIGGLVLLAALRRMRSPVL